MYPCFGCAYDIKGMQPFRSDFHGLLNWRERGSRFRYTKSVGKFDEKATKDAVDLGWTSTYKPPNFRCLAAYSYACAFANCLVK